MNPRRIILAGGSGFLGQALARHFHVAGWEAVVLSRGPCAGRAAREVAWDAQSPGEWARELDGAAAVVNLAGRTVDCRATKANRRLILESRVDSTRALGQAIARCAKPPPVWLNSSSATLYRHTLGPAWDESGADFSPTPAVHDAFSIEVIHAWERALEEAPLPHTRKIALRTTLALGRARNSVFPVMCRLARLGLGGRMGNGAQYVSWIHERDFVRAVAFLIERKDIAGPVNLAAPHPVPNHEFMRAFRELVGARFGLPASEWMLELGAFVMRTETELILKSRRVVPGTLLEAGFEFAFPTLPGALANLRSAPAGYGPGVGK